MLQPEFISPLGRQLLDRRGFLRTAGLSAASLGLLQMLDGDGLLANTPATAGGKSPIRPQIDPNNPYAPRPPHFPMPAKQVLVIYCPGAVSHVDTFDYKPELEKYHGQKPPGIPAVTFEGPTGNIAKPFWTFRPRGETGKMVSDLLPHLAEQADDFCFIHSLTTETSAHPQGENFFNTGFTMEGFPSFGAWVTYALGTDNQNLPAFVAINDPRGLARSGKNNLVTDSCRPRSKALISMPQIHQKTWRDRAASQLAMTPKPVTSSSGSTPVTWRITRVTRIWLVA